MHALLCGYGSMGRNHFRVLKESEQIDKLDVFDLYADVPPEHKVKKLNDFLATHTPDLAIIATPTRTHRDLAELLLSKSIPTLIEKPLAASTVEALSIQKIAREHDAIGIVGYIERCNPVVRALRNEIRDSKIFSIAITRVGPFPPRVKDVGVLIDLSVHDIDLVGFLLDQTPIIESRVYKSQHFNTHYEDNAVITLRFEGDIIANLITNWLTPFKKRTIEVATDKAYYEANLISRELKAYSHYTSNNSFVVRSCNVSPGEPLALQLQAFLDYINTRQQDCLATLEDGLQTIEIIEKHRKSELAPT